MGSFLQWLSVVGLAAIVVAIGAWLYGIYQIFAASRAYLQSMPSFRRGLREIFWPDITDATRSLPLSPAFILRRNKARRGMTVFFVMFFAMMIVALVGAVVQGLSTSAVGTQPDVAPIEAR